MDTLQRAQIEDLYFDMFDKLNTYARSSLKNDSLAEEAVQETFAIACRRPEELLSSENPRGWLTVTLKNVIRGSNRNRIATQIILAKYILAHKDALTSPEHMIDPKLLYENVAHTEEFRLLAELAIEGRSYEELANVRGITVSACRKRVERAKKILQKNI